jgi:hypothetical protein
MIFNSLQTWEAWLGLPSESLNLRENSAISPSHPVHATTSADPDDTRRINSLLKKLANSESEAQRLRENNSHLKARLEFIFDSELSSFTHLHSAKQNRASPLEDQTTLDAPGHDIYLSRGIIMLAGTRLYNIHTVVNGFAVRRFHNCSLPITIKSA